MAPQATARRVPSRDSVRAEGFVSWPKRLPPASGRKGRPYPWAPVRSRPALWHRAAGKGDPLALEVLDHVARQLGRGLALLVDLLNPECIVIGSVYARCEELLRGVMLRVLEREALPASLAACRILPAALGDQIGDFAALAIAMAGAEQA